MSEIFQLVKRNKPIKKSRLGFLRLDKNERVSKFSSNFIKLFKKRLSSEHLNAYPEIYNFYKLLSKLHFINKNYFLATAGIDSGLRNCIELFGNKKKLFKNINKNTSLIVISNPNSPTGTVLSVNEISNILTLAKKHNIKVVIDEAYYGFCKITAVSLVKKFKNLIVLRTFSKAFGLAGLRVGYIATHPNNIKIFENIKAMYEVNSIAILAANLLLENLDIKNKYLRDVNEGKKILINFFLKKRINFINCEGNFILFTLNKKKKIFLNKLKKNKIKIAENFSYKNLKNYSRVTLGPKKEMLNFIKILKSY